MPTDPRLAFIGAGNMASSLIQGLLKDGFAASQIHVADPVAEQLEDGRSPGRVILDHWESDWARSPERLIEYARY